MHLGARAGAGHILESSGPTAVKARFAERALMTQSLNGKRLLIVGAGSGIGRALAIAASDAHADVIVAGRDGQALDKTAAALGGRAQAIQLDLTDATSLDSVAGHILEPIDHVVCTAALPANGELSTLSYAEVVNAFGAKVIGPLMLVKALQPKLAPEASILLFSGIAAWRPSRGRVVMATTNGAVATLVAALAVELGPIRVNAISPGTVDSGLWDFLGDDKKTFFDNVAKANPSRRVGQPSDVISAALELLTNPFITGTTLHVDGGGRFS